MNIRCLFRGCLFRIKFYLDTCTQCDVCASRNLKLDRFCNIWRLSCPPSFINRGEIWQTTASSMLFFSMPNLTEISAGQETANFVQILIFWGSHAPSLIKAKFSMPQLDLRCAFPSKFHLNRCILYSCGAKTRRQTTDLSYP